MGPVIPSPLKRMIIEAYHSGTKVKEIARISKVKPSSVKSVIFRHKKDGQVKRIRKGKPRKLQPVHIEDLKTWVEQDCRRTLRDLADRLEQKYGVKVCESTLWNYLEELHFSVKRISPIPISRNTPENIEVRRVYGYKFLEMDRERDKVFYIDETGIAVHTRLNYGRSRRGQRANLTVRAIRGKNYSVCMAMNWKGIVLYEPQDKAFNSHFLR